MQLPQKDIYRNHEFIARSFSKPIIYDDMPAVSAAGFFYL